LRGYRLGRVVSSVWPARLKVLRHRLKRRPTQHVGRTTTREYRKYRHRRAAIADQDMRYPVPLFVWHDWIGYEPHGRGSVRPFRHGK